MAEMVELFFLGISIDTWANLWVAVGTISLAIISFLTIRYYKKQLDLTEKQYSLTKIEFGMKNAINHLKYIFNPLRKEIEIELKNIDEKIIYIDKNEPKFHSLEFPIPSQKIFYDGDSRGEILSGEESLKNRLLFEIFRNYPHFRVYIEQRHKMYHFINSEITNLKSELRSDGVCKVLTELIKKDISFEEYSVDDEATVFEEFTIIQNYEEEIIDGKRYQIPADGYYISLSNLTQTIQDLLAYEIIGVVIQGIDDELIEFTKSIRAEFLKKGIDPIILSTKSRIQLYFEDLRACDINIIDIIDSIKNEYKNQYNLSIEQLQIE